MSLADVELVRVETVAEAEEFLRWLSTQDFIAVDTETTGLKWWTPNFTRLVQIGGPDRGYTFGRNWFGVVAEALRKFTGPVVFHNARFDMHALDVSGLPVPGLSSVHDTQILHCLLDPLERHGLKFLGEKLIDRNAGVGEKLLKTAYQRGGWDWATVPEEVPAYGVYAAMDTVITARLYEKLMPQVRSRFLPQYEREMGALYSMYGCEKRGMRIDRTYTEELHDRWTDDQRILLGKMQAYGVQNPNSNRQIEAALRDQDWEPGEFTETGQAKLDKKVLEGLDYEIVGLLTEYKQKRKWCKAYLRPFLEDADSNGFIHPSINTMAARTGRMSVNGPPLQQLPKGYEIRRCILPSTGDRVIYATDYDSQEYRLFAHYSQDEGLLSAIRSGRDAHCHTASKVYGEEITDKEDPRRQLAKNTIYALMYGGGAAKIAETAGVDVATVENFITTMDAEFPGIKRFMRETEQLGRSRLGTDNRAWVETWGGRQFVADADKIYKLVNGLIQGGCADMLKEKLNALEAAGFGEYIYATVHDEVLKDVPEGQDGAEIAHEMARIMEERDAFAVPLSVEVTGPLPNWGEKYVKERAA